MNIALMLRALDEKGGVGVYTRHLVRELLALDTPHRFVLLYRGPEQLGRFADHERVVERVLPSASNLRWDQVDVPRALRAERADVVMNPKFSVPLTSPVPSVMVLHGAGWFIPEVKHFWSLPERVYARVAMPLYCRKAAAVLSVSKITTDVFETVPGVPHGRITTQYFGPGRQFTPVVDDERLRDVRERYGLPERFVLTLSGFTRGPRKNIANIIESFRLHHGATPHKLVVVGKDCHRFRETLGIPDDGWGADVVFPGWVDQDDLPAFYALADALLYPSKMEASPIPVFEGLACGRPIVTSNAWGLKELAGDAAVLVDPDDPRAIADALGRVLTDEPLRADLSRRALERSKRYTWDRYARETMALLERLGGAAA